MWVQVSAGDVAPTGQEDGETSRASVGHIGREYKIRDLSDLMPTAVFPANMLTPKAALERD